MSKLETDVVHRGEGAVEDARPLTTPIYESSTFVFASARELEQHLAGDARGYLYSRHANPTVEAAEAKLAALEGAPAALITSSGMAATATALFGLLSSGDDLLVGAGVYGGTVHLMTTFMRRFGVTVRLVPAGQDFEPHITAATRVVWFESPTNPGLRCIDIARVANACRARGVISVFDNTFASPVNQRPLDLGVDLVMHSATKYLNGHSDVIAGALVGPVPLIERLQGARSGGRLSAVARHEDTGCARGAAECHGAARGRMAGQRRACGHGVLSRFTVASRPCDCGTADDRVWRNGHVHGRRDLRRSVSRV